MSVKRGGLVWIVAGVLAAAVVWAGWVNFAARQQAARHSAGLHGLHSDVDHPLVGDLAPGFTLLGADGQPVALADYRGKPVLLNFWATWCGPCRMETPWIVELHRKYKAEGLEVLGISVDQLDRSDAARFEQSRKRVATFAKGLGIDYPVLIDGDKLAKPYGGLNVVPESLYVARDGTVVASQRGVRSKEEMEEKIKLALGY